MKHITLLYLIETISFQPALPDGPACAHTLPTATMEEVSLKKEDLILQDY